MYARAKTWRDALLIAAQLWSANPRAWEDLLDSVGLPAIAKEPFVTLPDP
jgi:hypothetical protein